MELGRREKMTLYLEPDVMWAVREEARKRHLPHTRAAADALRRALLDERAEGLADTVKMRLDRLEKRETIRAREIAILKETLLLFVRVWLEHTPPPEEELSDANSLSAEERFSEFLDLLAESLAPGGNLFDEAPHGRQAPESFEEFKERPDMLAGDDPFGATDEDPVLWDEAAVPDRGDDS